ncbi:MAG: VWA domain-containing protein [Acidobacteriota bacterium]
MTNSIATGQKVDFSQALEVRLVEVEIVVTDGKGRPILDLGPTDFELRVDGEKQSISSFSGPASADVEAVETLGHQPGSLVLFFDNNNIETLQRNAIIESVKSFLGSQAQLDVPWMVSASTATDFRLYQTFTRNPQDIDRALDEVAQNLAKDQRVAEYQDIFRELQRLSSAVQDFSGRGIAPQVQSLAGRIQAFSDQARDDALRGAGYIWRLSDSIAGLPGKQAILYIGGVLTLNPAAALYGALRDVLGSRTGPEAQETGARMPAGVASEGPVSLEKLAEHVSANGVTFYAISDPGRRDALWGGVTVGSMEAAPGDAPDPQDVWSPGVGFRSRNEATETVDTLARASGGLARIGARSVESTFEAMAVDQNSYYLLRFQPTQEPDGELHRLEVKVDRKAADARYRDHYRATTWDQETAAVVRSSLHYGANGNPFDVRIDRGDIVDAEGSASRLPLSLQIPLSKLTVVSAGADHRGQVTLFYTAGSSDLASIPVRKIVLPISIPNENLLEAIGQSILYRIDVDLPRGCDRVVVGVRDDLDDRLSINRIWLDDDPS